MCTSSVPGIIDHAGFGAAATIWLLAATLTARLPSAPAGISTRFPPPKSSVAALAPAVSERVGPLVADRAIEVEADADCGPELGANGDPPPEQAASSMQPMPKTIDAGRQETRNAHTLRSYESVLNEIGALSLGENADFRDLVPLRS
jgi:hypothetical protein